MYSDKIEAVWISFVLAIVMPLMTCCQFESPKSQEKLEAVTFSQFKDFVGKTGYVTDAEKFGWSIVQKDLFDFSTVAGANWRKPDGRNKPESQDLPVTQISYNDACAYCEWSGSRLPTYDEYWLLIDGDKRKVITDNNGPISSANTVNILGNVWDITSTKNNGNIRLAGGSLFCSPNTCNGTVKEREFYVDEQTANIHIGFAVVRQ
jgi:hypothetical protein